MNILAWIKFLIPASKHDIERLQMKVSEVSGGLEAISTQLSKAKAEILLEIDNLKGSLADVDLPQAAVDSFAKLQGIAQALDDINPDPAPAPTPTPEPAPPTP